ncbi:Uncharacterized protein QTN25_000373 [Entamoeba marina]
MLSSNPLHLQKICNDSNTSQNPSLFKTRPSTSVPLPETPRSIFGRFTPINKDQQTTPLQPFLPVNTECLYGLSEIDHENQILSSTIKNMMFESSDMNNDDANGVWEEMLLSCNVEVTSAVISLLMGQELPKAERDYNAKMMIIYYDQNKKLADLMKFCAIRDTYLKYNETSQYSPYIALFHFIIRFSQQSYMGNLIQSLQKNVRSVKKIELDEVSNSKSEKKMLTLRSLLQEFVIFLTDESYIHDCLKYGWNLAYYACYRTNINIVNKYMIDYMYNTPFNNVIDELTKSVPKHKLNTLFVISKLFHELLTPTTKDTYWKEWVHNNCEDLKVKLFSFIQKVSEYTVQEEKIRLSLPTTGITPLITFLNSDWEQLRPYLTTEGYKMIEMHMTLQVDIKQHVLSLIKTLHQLRVNTFTENNNYMSKISIMNMRIKDLREEKRYLRRLLLDDED